MQNISNQITKDPNTIEPLNPDQLLLLLTDIQERLTNLNEFPLLRFQSDKNRKTTLYFAGDTHGDLKVSRWLAEHIFKHSMEVKEYDTKIIFLGDYIDRAPEDVPYGGVKNVLYLLCLKTLYPDKIYLLRGNHECHELLPYSPYELPIEIDRIWGREHLTEIHDQFIKIFSLLPLYILTSNGLFASHSGFPKNQDTSKVSYKDETSILETLWGDPNEFASYRGPISPKTNYTKQEFTEFMGRLGTKVMLRGHDYAMNGYSIYDDRLLTIFSSRRYMNCGAGGVLVCKIELQKKIINVQDLMLFDTSKNKFENKTIERR